MWDRQLVLAAGARVPRVPPWTYRKPYPYGRYGFCYTRLYCYFRFAMLFHTQMPRVYHA